MSKEGVWNVSSSVLLAIGESSLSDSLRQLLENGGLNVLQDEVFSLKYLDDHVQGQLPNIVIIHDLYLPSEAETQEEKDEEVLQLLEKWRADYDNDLRVVYMCVREHSDPFIGQLVARNVLDIFNKKNISSSSFVNQLLEPPRFKNVQRLSIGNLDVEFLEEDEVAQPQSIAETLEFEAGETYSEPQPTKIKPEKEPLEIGKKIGNVAGNIAKGTTGLMKGVSEIMPKGSSSENEHNELMMNDLLDLMPIEVDDSNIKSAIIGTVLIAVTGTKEHIGSTHTALSVAAYLSKVGHSVAIIECNDTDDFEKIHALYEGTKQYLKKEHFFEINGIHHYKYRSNFDLNMIYYQYEYVIIDYGDLDEATGYIEEFKRAHIRLVVTSGDEWKTNWVHEFMRKNKTMKEDCELIVPAVSRDKAEEFAELLKYDQVFAFPRQDNPYEITTETEQLVHTLLGSYIKAPLHSKMVSPKVVVLACSISIIATAAVVTILNYL